MVEEAYAACEVIAREHYENFPVASWLVPAHLRRHVAAIYAFARSADDIADEPGRSPEERLILLAEWSAALRRPPITHIFEALADTRRQFDLPLSLFDDLLHAFAQDVVKSEYGTWDEVFDYCRRSANPVGRLILLLNRIHGEEEERWSDAVCTALQLTNFWQDLAIDWARGRLYVPRAVWAAAGADLGDLTRREMTPAWQQVLRHCRDVTGQMFERGRPICDVFRGRMRYELRATWLGGTTILDKLQRSDFDVFRKRPRLTMSDALVIALKALTWRAIPRSTTRS